MSEESESTGAGLTADERRSDGFERDELEALRDRDPEALAKFFDVYFDRVYGYVRRLLGEEHLAEDVTQDVFMHIHRSLPSFDAARELRPWVFTIATNKVRDFWRSRRHRDSQREQSVEREAAADHLSERADLRPENSLAQVELDDRVRDAVDRLPDGMRNDGPPAGLRRALVRGHRADPRAQRGRDPQALLAGARAAARDARARLPAAPGGLVGA